MPGINSSGKLPLAIKLGFGVGDLGGNLFFTIMGFYLLYFLTNTLGLEAALAGTALMIGKVWDAVTDPAVGYLSDITVTRMGRRRPYMLWGAVGLFFCMPIMFMSPPVSGQAGLFLWAAGVYCLLNTAYTFVNIPYGALTPELTSDYNERSVLSGWRMSFAVLGTFIGAGLVLPVVGLFGGEKAGGWLGMAAVMGLIMLATTLITVLVVKEPERPAAPPSTATPASILRSYAEVLRQRPFLLALIPWALHISGITMIQSALLYYFQYIYGDRDAFQLALIILLACAIVFIPVWVLVSRFTGKKLAYNLGMGLFAATVLVFFFFGENGGVGFAYAVMAAAGIGFAAQYAMPYAIVPDVVEYDYAENGARREGVYYGLWTFTSKLGASLAILLSGWILSFSGYVPDAVQTESARFGIRLLAGIVPALFFVAGVIVHSFYPINAKSYEEIRRKAQERTGQSAQN
jgi:GPH family glycoside/pentoside/hexuronide:cation symporter